mgnify:CR=1 FL=1
METARRTIRDDTTEGAALPYGIEVLYLVTVVLLAHARILGFAHTPEDWSQLSLLRERSCLASLLPFDEYPYYRPLWFYWLSVADRSGLSGGLAHLGPLAMHLLGCLAVHRGLANIAGGQALALASCIAIAPGLSSALAWLAAGNKAFVFGFLAFGFLLLLRVRGFKAYAAAFFVAALPALMSSENAYLAVLLMPCVALCLRPRSLDGSSSRRLVGTLGLGLAITAVALVHLLLLSPQRNAGADDRVGQLLAALRGDPLNLAIGAWENIGRYFAHGVGIGDDLPRFGGTLLIVLACYAVVARSRLLGMALVFYVILNIPASLFPNESSRHQAYLPALGAGAVAAATMLSLRGVAAYCVPVLNLAFLAATFAGYGPWADYCKQSENVFESSFTVLPRSPVEAPLLVNVPMEYRAAFHLRFGRDANVGAWPGLTVLSSADEVLVPADFEVRDLALSSKPSGLAIEYDGTRLVRTSLDAILARRRAPLLRCTQSVLPFTRPWLAWGECLTSFSTAAPARGFVGAGADSAKGNFERVVKLDAHGPLAGEPGLYWECTIEAGPPAFVVLGWTPWSVLPTTENAWLFTLAPLPWAFKATVFRWLSAWSPSDAQVVPVYGFVPAVHADGGAQRLRVELRLR